jgi:hypothetical protein
MTKRQYVMLDAGIRHPVSSIQFYIFIFLLFLIAATAPAYARVTFTDVTVEVGLGDVTDINTGATWGDYDNDGDADVFLFRGGAGKELYRNEEDGRFVHVTQIAGIADPSVGASSAIFLDFDNDGYLDLFMGGEGSDLGDILYQNNGDNTFTNISQVAGMESEVRAYYGPVSFDYDSDGLLDIYVGNYAQITFPNFLYHNEGNGRFREMAAEIGLDKPQLCSGVSLGDYDDDGDLDILVAAGFSSDLTVENFDALYQNEGNGVFIDVAQQSISMGSLGITITTVILISSSTPGLPPQPANSTSSIGTMGMGHSLMSHNPPASHP